MLERNIFSSRKKWENNPLSHPLITRPLITKTATWVQNFSNEACYHLWEGIGRQFWSWVCFIDCDETLSPANFARRVRLVNWVLTFWPNISYFMQKFQSLTPKLENAHPKDSYFRASLRWKNNFRKKYFQYNNLLDATFYVLTLD